MKFQEDTNPVVLPSPHFTVGETGERFVANPNGGLIAVPENVARALNNTQGMDSSNASNTQNSLNLTPEQIKAISDEIEKKLPFGSALVPVLTALGFTNRDEKNGRLILGVNEYEIFKTKAQKGPHQMKEVPVIRMPNYVLESEKTDMANKAMTAIRSLFPGRTLHFTLKALNDSADEHGIYPGFRNRDDSESDYVDDAVCSWVEGVGGAVDAPYAWRDRDGRSFSYEGNRQNALCLVASFG